MFGRGKLARTDRKHAAVQRGSSGGRLPTGSRGSAFKDNKLDPYRRRRKASVISVSCPSISPVSPCTVGRLPSDSPSYPGKKLLIYRIICQRCPGVLATHPERHVLDHGNIVYGRCLTTYVPLNGRATTASYQWVSTERKCDPGDVLSRGVTRAASFVLKIYKDTGQLWGKNNEAALILKLVERYFIFHYYVGKPLRQLSLLTSGNVMHLTGMYPNLKIQYPLIQRLFGKLVKLTYAEKILREKIHRSVGCLMAGFSEAGARLN